MKSFIPHGTEIKGHEPSLVSLLYFEKKSRNCFLISLKLIFRWLCCTESRQQLVLGSSDYWHSQRSPHIPCHGEVTQRFSVLSFPSALWESDQKQFYDQELLTFTSCQESERRGSKWSAAHIPTHVQRGTHITANRHINPGTRVSRFGSGCVHMFFSSKTLILHNSDNGCFSLKCSQQVDATSPRLFSGCCQKASWET